MRAALIIMRKDLLRRLRSPIASIIYLLFPFVFAGLMALAFGSGGDARAPRFRVVLVDEDDNFISRFILSAFGQEQMNEFFESSEGTRVEAEGLIAENKVSGAIIIPAGFSRAVMRREATQLEVVRNPAEAIGPLAIEEVAAMIVEFLDGGSRVLAEPLGEMDALITELDSLSTGSPWDAFPSDARVGDLARAVNQSLRQTRRFAFPPVIRVADVESAEPEEGEEEGGGNFGVIFAYMLPGMASFALMFLVLGFMADIPRERTIGTLDRQRTAPIYGTQILAGKVLSSIAMGFVVILAMVLIAALLLNVRAEPFAFLALCIAFLLAANGTLALVFGLARNERQGGTIGSIVVMMMSFLGGSWMPLDSLPGFLQRLAPGTLNYWAIRGFRDLLLEAGGWSAIGQPALILCIIGAAGILIGGWGMQRQLMRGL